MSEQRLLILSCSGTKRVGSDQMPAIERYDGPSYRVLRKFIREHPENADNLTVHILSAEFGLISQDYPVPLYDRRMTSARAIELQGSVIASLSGLLESRHYTSLLISASAEYLKALNGYRSIIPTYTRVQESTASQGRKLSELYEWLYGMFPVVRTSKTKTNAAQIRCSAPRNLDTKVSG